ncbi:MAG: hypothetical protein L0241_22740 [Planctomycetia bacterium]|nr:hypothetical protein [Planctomycetia bacterium]
MLKITALALVVLMGGVVGSTAFAGETGMKRFPSRIGTIGKGSDGAKMKHFPRKLDKKVGVAGSSKVLAPRRLPGL